MSSLRAALPALLLLLSTSSGFFLLFDSPPVSATDVPGGPITEDTTWDKAGSPYIIMGDVYVNDSANLTIEPGVRVLFDDSGTDDPYSIFVNGTLYAVGTPSENINFSSNNSLTPTPGDWGSLWINEAGKGQFAYVNVRHALTGMHLFSNGNDILTSTFELNQDESIFVEGSSGNNIIGNNITGLTFGIRMVDSSANLIFQNEIHDQIVGISLINSSQNIIQENEVFSNANGIFLTDSGDNDLLDNIVHDQSNLGIALENVRGSQLMGNSMDDNTNWNLFIDGDEGTDYELEIDTSNMINGKPVHYYYDLSGTLDGTDVLNAGYLGVTNSKGVIIHDLIVQDAEVFLLAFISSSIIDHMSVNTTSHGFLLTNSNNNRIQFSHILLNDDSGIELVNSNNNVLRKNQVDNNPVHGILLVDSVANTIISNNITDNGQRGVFLQE